MKQLRYVNFVEALAISTIMALIMVGMALGILCFRDYPGVLLHPGVVLMVAVLFIIGSVFFNSLDGNRVKSLVSGGVFSIMSTLLILCVGGGILFSWNGGAGSSAGMPNINTLTSSIAVCMIISMVMVNLLISKEW